MTTIRRVAKAWCLLLLLLPLSLVAQTIRLEAPQTVVQGNTFQLIYSYSGSEDFERVSEPKAQGLQVVYGPARQVMSSYQNINGRSSSSSSVSITYTLIAERTGSISVPAVTAVVGGKRVKRGVHGPKASGAISIGPSPVRQSSMSNRLSPSDTSSIRRPNSISVASMHPNTTASSPRSNPTMGAVS